jgi:hypothetical protein
MPVYIRYLDRGTIQKFWKAELRDRIVLTTSGAMGASPSITAKTYRHKNAAEIAIRDELVTRGREGYYSVTASELSALRKAAKVPVAESAPSRTAAKAKANKKTARPLAKKKTRRAVARANAKPATARRDPVAAPDEARAGAAMYVVRISSSRRDQQVRATSGGRPILAKGQDLPVCALCNDRLSLYLQFDVEQRFALPFEAGSHFLLFNCASCDAIPVAPPRGRLPASWLDPSRRDSWRIILNRPRRAEQVERADAIVREQSVSFTTSKETLRHGLDGEVGSADFKVGGVPHWVQPSRRVQCACGAAMGFLLQVPFGSAQGWRFRRGGQLPFCADLNAYVFACTAQCSPHATLLLAER